MLDGGVRTAAGVRERFDVVVGADGASSLVRRTFLGPPAPRRLSMAGGWLADGDAPMIVRFTPGLPGYLWVFPRGLARDGAAMGRDLADELRARAPADFFDLFGSAASRGSPPLG